MEVDKYASLKTGINQDNALNSPENWRIDPLKAVSPQLRLILRDRIIRNDLKPSSSISETELAKTFKVSRQPVREAFITLVNEDLVEIRPQRGSYVKRINYESVLNGRFVREAVEADIVKRVARKAGKSLVAELRAQLRDQRKCKNGLASSFIELDEKFHRTLADAAGMHKVWDFLEAAKLQMDRVRYITSEEFPTGKLIEQHKLIVDCIEDASPSRAQTAMRNHLREVLQSLPEVLKRHPDYFDNVEASAETPTRGNLRRLTKNE